MKPADSSKRNARAWLDGSSGMAILSPSLISLMSAIFSEYKPSGANTVEPNGINSLPLSFT